MCDIARLHDRFGDNASRFARVGFDVKQQRKQANAVRWLKEAIVLHNQGRLDEADSIYLKVLRDSPGHPDALHLRALVAIARGNFDQSAKLAGMAISAAPQVANFYNTAGNALRNMGRYEEARVRLKRAVEIDAGFSMAHHNLALTLESIGDIPAAMSANHKALECDPNYLEAQLHALRLAIVGRDRAATDLIHSKLMSIGNSCAIQRATVQYYLFLASECIEQESLEAAEEYAKKAVDAMPGSIDAWLKLGAILDLRCDLAGAEAAYVEATKIQPPTEAGQLSLGQFLAEQKRAKEAEAVYLSWLEGHPESVSARFGLAGIKLARGDFEQGWQYYESRWDLPAHASPRFLGAPQWSGGRAKRLLLYAEQGLGDTLQMLRFIPRVLRLGLEEVVLLVPPVLVRVAASVSDAPCLRVVSELDADTWFDYACPLMSLPYVLGANSKQELAMEKPYLWADRVRQDYYNEKLSALSGRRLGLVWQGGKAGFANKRRIIPEEIFLPLFDIPDWSMVSLQVGSEPSIAGSPLFNLAASIADFYDLAAAMSCLDAIVCVDTGPAHLAGALGLPCFTLVPCLHDWRWAGAGSETYWYPQMKLIRQTPERSWRQPQAELVAAIKNTLDCRHTQ